MTHREPFWQVQAVFDPDGYGGDFSYTMGLAACGKPELHLWGRPSLGEDPGEDWKLSMRDTGGLLNELAWDLLDGRLRVGDRFAREYDDGLVTVRYQKYGPRTPLVLALMARLWQADALDLGGLVQVAAYVDGAGALTYPTSVSRTAAREVGRHHALAAIDADVHDFAHELGHRWLRKAFAEMQRDVMGAEQSPQQRRQVVSNLGHLLADSLISAASVEAMADKLPLPTRLSGLGPFLGGLVGPGEPPGPEWVASPVVLDAVTGVASAPLAGELIDPA